MKIIEAGIDNIQELAILFDRYRQFYERESDIEAGKKFLSDRMNRKESVIFLALSDNDEAMAFVQLYPSFTSVDMMRMWILNDLYVDDSFRRTRVGEALLNRCRELAVATNAKGLILETRNSNTPARNLYEKFGFFYDDVHAYYFLPTEPE